MRLSEKTLELNICSQLAKISPYQIIWFGLTQRQEAKLGFDTCAELGGRLLIFQFKASCNDVRGKRRFCASHKQLIELKKNCGVSNTVFYVFPLIGTTSELLTKTDILKNTWLLDVSELPDLHVPTTSSGSQRKSSIHYIDVEPPTAVIRSKPVEVSLINMETLLQASSNRGVIGNNIFDNGVELSKFQNNEDMHTLNDNGFSRFDSIRKLLGRNSAGAILLNC